MGLAEALANCGYHCDFLVCDYEPAHRLLDEKHFQFSVIDDGALNEQSLQSMDDLLLSRVGVVMNHRYARIESMNWVMSKKLPLAVIDQLGGKCVNCDLVVNASPVEKWHRYEVVGEDPKFLLGLDYAVLRPTFLSEISGKSVDWLRRKRVLVTFGGVDRTGATLRTIEALQRIPQEYMSYVDVILGPGFPHHEAVENIKPKIDDRFHISSSVNDMPSRMEVATLAINSGGTTLNELAYCAVPGVVLWEDPHEKLMGEAFEALGAVKLLGNGLEVAIEDIAQSVQKLLVDPSRLEQMSKVSERLVDGQGLARIIKALRICFDNA